MLRLPLLLLAFWGPAVEAAYKYSYKDMNQNRYDRYAEYNGGSYAVRGYYNYTGEDTMAEGQFTNHYSYSSHNNNTQAKYSSYAMKRENCENSVVRVSRLQTSCNSPYTFYYGNGAHRKSPTCAYGDKATFTISFTVTDDIEEVYDFYMTVAAFDPEGQLLAVSSPESVCTSYVGYDCTVAGRYTITKDMQFDYLNQNHADFVPVLRVAFSTMADSGYNLGAVNTQCRQWNEETPDYVQWKGMQTQSGWDRFWARYGLLLFSISAVLAMAFYVYRKSNNTATRDEVENYRSKREGLMN